ncbi:hypothetical protein DsansV1_C05g0058121 [Dioscorea sansibarensis]
MQWKLSRGKWRPRLLDFVSSLDESQVEIASRQAFQCLPDLSKAICELTVLKGVGPATASAVLAAYAPEVAPFMSDEAVSASMGSLKDYSLKQYLELSENGDVFTPSDVERALWSSAINSKLKPSQSGDGSEAGQHKRAKRKRRF